MPQTDRRTSMSSEAARIARKDFLKFTATGFAALISQHHAGFAAPPPPATAKTATDKFADRILSDTATAMLSFGAYIGDRLGIYRAMADSGPLTIAELAARTRLNERYMREWLALMATGGYVKYDPKTS